jgi:hypothetical protein
MWDICKPHFGEINSFLASVYNCIFLFIWLYKVRYATMVWHTARLVSLCLQELLFMGWVWMTYVANVFTYCYFPLDMFSSCLKIEDSQT